MVEVKMVSDRVMAGVFVFEDHDDCEADLIL